MAVESEIKIEACTKDFVIYKVVDQKVNTSRPLLHQSGRTTLRRSVVRCRNWWRYMGTNATFTTRDDPVVSSGEENPDFGYYWRSRRQLTNLNSKIKKSSV